MNDSKIKKYIYFTVLIFQSLTFIVSFTVSSYIYNNFYSSLYTFIYMCLKLFCIGLWKYKITFSVKAKTLYLKALYNV